MMTTTREKKKTQTDYYVYTAANVTFNHIYIASFHAGANEKKQEKLSLGKHYEMTLNTYDYSS